MFKIDNRPVWMPSGTQNINSHHHSMKDSKEYSILNKSWRRAPWPGLIGTSAEREPSPSQSSVYSQPKNIIDSLTISDFNVPLPIETSRVNTEEYNNNINREKLSTSTRQSNNLALTIRIINTLLIDQNNNSNNETSNNESDQLTRSDSFSTMKTSLRPKSSYGILIVKRGCSRNELLNHIEKQFDLYNQISDISIASRTSYSKKINIVSLSMGTLPEYPDINDESDLIVYVGGGVFKKELYHDFSENNDHQLEQYERFHMFSQPLRDFQDGNNSTVQEKFFYDSIVSNIEAFQNFASRDDYVLGRTRSRSFDSQRSRSFSESNSPNFNSTIPLSPYSKDYGFRLRENDSKKNAFVLDKGMLGAPLSVHQTEPIFFNSNTSSSPTPASPSKRSERKQLTSFNSGIYSQEFDNLDENLGFNNSPNEFYSSLRSDDDDKKFNDNLNYSEDVPPPPPDSFSFVPQSSTSLQLDLDIEDPSIFTSPPSNCETKPRSRTTSSSNIQLNNSVNLGSSIQNNFSSNSNISPNSRGSGAVPQLRSWRKNLTIKTEDSPISNKPGPNSDNFSLDGSLSDQDLQVNKFYVEELLQDSSPSANSVEISKRREKESPSLVRKDSLPNLSSTVNRLDSVLAKITNITRSLNSRPLVVGGTSSPTQSPSSTLYKLQNSSYGISHSSSYKPKQTSTVNTSLSSSIDLGLSHSNYSPSPQISPDNSEYIKSPTSSLSASSRVQAKSSNSLDTLTKLTDEIKEIFLNNSGKSNHLPSKIKDSSFSLKSEMNLSYNENPTSTFSNSFNESQNYESTTIDDLARNESEKPLRTPNEIYNELKNFLDM